jgi:hypothetical protein
VSIHAESFGDGSSRKLGELTEPAQAEALELRVAVGRQRKQREWQRLEELLLF